FSMGMPYTEANLKAFLQQHAASTALEQETLCQTRKGRSVELLRFGKLDGEPRHRVFFTARHHACEMMASYALEGVIQAALADDETGKWFRENVELRAVPFMDKDGVEDGDQGKNRRPHDHNRDYAGEPLYASVAAVKKMLPAWSGGKLKIALDLHCPALRGRENEIIHFVGGPDAGLWRRATRLSQLLEELSAQSPLRFRESDNLPFGKSWNTARFGVASIEKSFGHWVGTLPGLRIGATLELPYAASSGQEVNAETARAFGRNVAAAVRAYLMETESDALRSTNKTAKENKREPTDNFPKRRRKLRGFSRRQPAMQRTRDAATRRHE
ncbi:MAG: M14 family zinc carboxypeptidase, partial [Opitutaceae bacterium]